MATFDTEFLDPTLPDVTLKIGGKVRRLAFDYKAFVIAEKLTGQNLLTGAFGDVSMTSLGGLLYASLLKHDPELTLDEVSSWLTFRNATVVYSAITHALIGSFPEPKAGEVGESKAQVA